MNSKIVELKENGIYMVWEVDMQQCLKLLHFSSVPFQRENIKVESLEYGFRFVELGLSGFDRPFERHGNKFIVTAPGYRMKYAGHSDNRNRDGRILKFILWDNETDVYVDSYLQFYDGLSIVRCWQVVRNKGTTAQTLEYISTFNYEGIEKEGLHTRDEKMRLGIPHNSWQRELNWKFCTLPQLGIEQVQPDMIQRSSGMVRISNTGNWSSKEYLPMGYLENIDSGTGMFWQIENNGSWHWEIGDQNGHLYLALGGPNEVYSHWSRTLKPGELFTSVPAAVGVTDAGFEEGMKVLTSYRRRIRRINKDNQTLPVIFNDYMNCLWGKPTAEEEFPLIDAAAEAGCEYFCIDAGWYADGDWWDSVGEWKESKKRFPEGMRRITDYIRSKGMIPGVWLELEVMGIYCHMAEEMSDDCFFIRHGKRVYDRSRFQLDYRNPKVREYADCVIDRIVSEYGVGYIKMDYNIEPGIGTELNADSFGDGLLEHERSYLNWLDQVWKRYPDLVIENCSSGGLRMDYAMLSRYSIQSTSDQDDYRLYATIAANAPTAVTPEQAAVWAYPMNHEGEVGKEELQEETVFNMINSMLLRIHQSGHLAKLDEERKSLVKEGISVYKEIRKDIAQGFPFWPIGLSQFKDEWSSLGIQCDKVWYLAVWRRSGSQSIKTLPVQELKKRSIKVSRVYPAFGREPFEWNSNVGQLTVEFLRENMARLYRLELE
ncbi:glycoside hydrolase family 36 protein [Lacrimispora sp.]|uniref:glycoside hydrolase family 36 protein n=1 Tax=Lacrimispora sp. TaxID=2719234 RepID=UPI0029E61BFF|nr:alpha-galactosidase [Lacrimispora sp.]